MPGAGLKRAGGLIAASLGIVLLALSMLSDPHRFAWSDDPGLASQVDADAVLAGIVCSVSAAFLLGVAFRLSPTREGWGGLGMMRVVAMAFALAAIARVVFLAPMASG